MVSLYCRRLHLAYSTIAVHLRRAPLTVIAATSLSISSEKKSTENVKEPKYHSVRKSKSRNQMHGIACRVGPLLIQNEQLEQVDTFLYLGFLITEDGKCTTEFRTRLYRGQAIGTSMQKI